MTCCVQIARRGVSGSIREQYGARKEAPATDSAPGKLPSAVAMEA